MALGTVVTYAAVAVALTAAARALAPITWLMVKPLSCDLCMSFWCSAAALALSLCAAEPLPHICVATAARLTLQLWGSTGVAMLGTRLLNAVRLPPPGPPPGV